MKRFLVMLSLSGLLIYGYIKYKNSIVTDVKLNQIQKEVQSETKKEYSSDCKNWSSSLSEQKKDRGFVKSGENIFYFDQRYNSWIQIEANNPLIFWPYGEDTVIISNRSLESFPIKAKHTDILLTIIQSITDHSQYIMQNSHWALLTRKNDNALIAFFSPSEKKCSSDPKTMGLICEKQSGCKLLGNDSIGPNDAVQCAKEFKLLDDGVTAGIYRACEFIAQEKSYDELTSYFNSVVQACDLENVNFLSKEKALQLCDDGKNILEKFRQSK
jgi:hypothetical protein